MRRAALIRSVQRLVEPGAVVHDAAYMWARHKWMVPYGALWFLTVVALAPIGGIDDWSTRVAIGFAVAGVAVTATTEYRVLALVDDRMVMFTASKIRQVARRKIEEIGWRSTMAPVGGTVLAADWQIGDQQYTVSRSSEQAMSRIAASGPDDAR